MGIQDIVDLLGLSYENRGDSLMLVCPLPEHADTRASFKIWLEEDRFFCFGCEGRGDALDLYAQVRGLDKDTAVQEVERLTGVRLAPKAEPDRLPETVARSLGESALAQMKMKLEGPEHARWGERLDKICWAYRKTLIDADQLRKAMRRYLSELREAVQVS